MRNRLYITIFFSTWIITLISCATSAKVSRKQKFGTDSVTTETNGKIIHPPDSSTAADSNEVADSLRIINDSLAVADSLPKDTTVKPPKKFLDAKVDYLALDSIVFDVKNKKMYLYDSVRLDYTTITLESSRADIDLGSQELHAIGVYDSIMETYHGNPIFTESGKSFMSKELRYNFKSRKGRIIEAVTNEGETYLHAQVAKIDSNDAIYIKNAKFTTCSDPVPHYHIATTKGKMVPNDIIVTGPANLQIENIPTPLVLPFGFFPIREGKKSGIVLPEYGELQGFGFFLKNFGYYFAINDRFDLTLYGDIYTSLSFGVKTNFNYKTRYKLNGSLDLGFSQLQSGDPQIPAEYNDFRRERNFRIAWRHQQDPKANPYSTFNATVNVQTGNYGLYNSNNVNNIVQNQFNSTITYTRTFPNTPVNLSVAMRHDQNTLSKTISITLPEFVLNVTRFYPFKRKKQTGTPKWYETIGVTYSMNIRNQLSTNDSIFINHFSRALGNTSAGVQQTVNIATSFKLFKYFSLNPSIAYREVWNFRNLDIKYDPGLGTVDRDTLLGFFDSRELRADVDLTTNIYGMYVFKRGNLKAIRHVMTPSVRFTYRPDFSDRLTGYYGNNGELITYSPNDIGIFGAPPGQNGLVALSLNNNLEMKVKSRKDTVTGEKKIMLLESFRLDMSYDLAADSLNFSNLTLSGRTTILNIFGINFAFDFDPYGIDTVNGVARRVNRFALQQSKELFRFTRAMVNITINFRGESKSKRKLTESQTSLQELYRNDATYNFVDFNIPYSFSVGYNVIFSKPLDQVSLTHTINFMGDFNITSKWKVRFNLNYDFVSNRIATSSIELFRDLHCWEMRLGVIPFGEARQFKFTIAVKSQLLQALKLNYGNGRFNY